MAQAYEKAASAAREFLQLYAVVKPPRLAFGPGTVNEVQRTLKEALREAHIVLQEASRRAFEARVATLKRVQNRQLIVNGMHLVSGSAFVLLIANQFPDAMKWSGAGISFAASVTALFIPKNIAELEAHLAGDINEMTRLLGEIAQAQVQLVTSNIEEDQQLAQKTATLIGLCAALAARYELDRLALRVGYLPRGDLTVSPAQAAAKG